MRITYEDRVVIETLRQESQTKHLQHQIIACLIDWQLLVIAHFFKISSLRARNNARRESSNTLPHFVRESSPYPSALRQAQGLQGVTSKLVTNPERNAPKNRLSYWRRPGLRRQRCHPGRGTRHLRRSTG